MCLLYKPNRTESLLYNPSASLQIPPGMNATARQTHATLTITVKPVYKKQKQTKTKTHRTDSKTVWIRQPPLTAVFNILKYRNIIN